MTKLRHASRFITRLATAVLLLTSVPLDRSTAGHDIKEALNDYKGSCELYKGVVEKLQYYITIGKVLKAKNDNHCKGIYIGDQYCANLDTAIMNNYQTTAELKADIIYVKKLCDDHRSKYINALTERLTMAVLTGALPEPGVIPQKPPHSIAVSARRSRSGGKPSRRRRKPPQVGHSTSQSQALAVIGGMIIQGIQRGSRRGHRSGGKPPTRSSGGGSSGGGVKSPGRHSTAATIHQDRLRRGMY